MPNSIIWDSLSAGGALVGFFMPLLISLVKKYIPVDNRPLNFTITIILSVIGAVVAMWVDGKFVDGAFQLANIWTTLIQVFIVSQAAYNYFWKPTGTSDRIEDTTKL